MNKTTFRDKRRKRRGQKKGRAVDPVAYKEVCDLLGERPLRRDLLIEYLHLIQDGYGHISAAHIAALAEAMGLATTEVYEVASFYHHFDIVREGGAPPPALTVRVCDSITCEMYGAEALLQDLGAVCGDGVRIQRVPCVGRCETPPVAVVGTRPVCHATTATVREAVERVGASAPPLRRSQAAPTLPRGESVSDSPASKARRLSREGESVSERALPLSGEQSSPTLPRGESVSERALRLSGEQSSPTLAADARAVLYDAYCAEHDGYALLRRLCAGETTGTEIIARLEQSGLRGLGGAGFPVGRKWKIVAGQDAPRYMAVNIDEGEPGTFKDRHYLERDPHRFLEGMLIAAEAVGAERVYIYLRDEYAAVRALLEEELARLRANPPAPLPAIELRRGAGAYICGEESAMIESIEGKRGMPRLRPPFVAEVGLFGRPTLEHNMETLYWVREIIDKGAEWFASHGRNGRVGLRSFSVSGRVKKPGVHLAPAGITVTELIDEHCGGMQDGHAFYAYFPGGASGGILPASMGDIPLDFDTLNEHGCFIGSAAVIVLSDKDSARAAAVNAMRFFSHESCGKCTPCRVGTAKAVKLMEKPAWDVGLMNELSQVMADASICGLGQAAPNPLQCVIKYFPEELD